MSTGYTKSELRLLTCCGVQNQPSYFVQIKFFCKKSHELLVITCLCGSELPKYFTCKYVLGVRVTLLLHVYWGRSYPNVMLKLTCDKEQELLCYLHVSWVGVTQTFCKCKYVLGVMVTLLLHVYLGRSYPCMVENFTM